MDYYIANYKSRGTEVYKRLSIGYFRTIVVLGLVIPEARGIILVRSKCINRVRTVLVICTLKPSFKGKDRCSLLPRGVIINIAQVYNETFEILRIVFTLHVFSILFGFSLVIFSPRSTRKGLAPSSRKYITPGE